MNMIQVESSMKTHKVYLKTLDLFSISYSANAKAMFGFLSLTLQLRVIGVGYGL
jgi:hypothetical protein